MASFLFLVLCILAFFCLFFFLFCFVFCFFKKFYWILFYFNFILFLNFTNCISFAKYQNESATGIHVFPILNPPPSSLLPPHTIPLGRLCALAPSFQYHASNLDWQLISYMILYMFQCHFYFNITEIITAVIKQSQFS